MHDFDESFLLSTQCLLSVTFVSTSYDVSSAKTVWVVFPRQHSREFPHPEKMVCTIILTAHEHTLEANCNANDSMAYLAMS